MYLKSKNRKYLWPPATRCRAVLQGHPEYLEHHRDDTDTCGNKWVWRQKYTPIALAREVIKQAKEDQLGAYFVTTGGANNTNWVEVLAAVTQCRALEYLNAWLENTA